MGFKLSKVLDLEIVSRHRLGVLHSKTLDLGGAKHHPNDASWSDRLKNFLTRSTLARPSFAVAFGDAQYEPGQLIVIHAQVVVR